MRLRLTIVACVATLLGTVGLYPLYESGGWFGTGCGAILVVGVAGALTRRFRVAAALCPLIGLAALFLYLTVRFAAGQALLAVVPTPSSTARLGRLLGEGWHDANAYAAPVPMLPAINMLTSTGIGLVAVLIDFLAVRARRAALAGLPLLAIYSVPAAVRQQTAGWLAFLLSAGGYLGLLVSDARDQLAGWGRAVFTARWSAAVPAGERPDSSPLAAAGRRIGLAAVAVAIVLPFAVPGIEPRGLLGIGGNGGSGSGKGSGSITGLDALNPLVSVRRQLVREGDAEVLKYRTTDGGAPDYLRMYSLDRFNGETWSIGPLRAGQDGRVADKELPAEPGTAAIPARAVTTNISIDSRVHGLDVLPMPYPPTKVNIKGDWRVDPRSLTVFSTHDSAGGRSYTVTSIRPEPTYQELVTEAAPPDSITSRYLAVPDSVGDDVAKLAAQLTAGASTPYEQAVKLQDWFTKPGNFTYSLTTPPPRRGNALRDFLFTSRTGYCEQFASSMAVLARILGIPARVGMGYTAGTQQSNGEWLVRTKDAHAWPELYFTGVGWLRFEPTPGGDGGQGSATVPSYTAPQLLPGAPGSDPETQLPTTGSGSGSAPSSAPTVPRHRTDTLADSRAAPGAVPESHTSQLPVTWLLIGLVVLLLLLTPVTLRALTRARRWRRAKTDVAVAHAAWDELRADAADHRLRWPASETPRATGRRLTETLALEGAAAEALTRLARAEERARYAPSTEPLATPREDVRLLRAALRARASRRVRWRARLFPPSVTMSLRSAGTRIMDVFEWLDVATPRRRRPT
ncbi:transglutaminaseTgpA domain-containing protein [Actinoallomurus sp. CA-142502]|uniref:transglutaminase family protein n=1 Tax=Actinoallomurus sp. CA-142502 TaxID=3239885 RepID=UPI003D94BD43